MIMFGQLVISFPVNSSPTSPHTHTPWPHMKTCPSCTVWWQLTWHCWTTKQAKKLCHLSYYHPISSCEVFQTLPILGTSMLPISWVAIWFPTPCELCRDVGRVDNGSLASYPLPVCVSLLWLCHPSAWQLLPLSI